LRLDRQLYPLFADLETRGLHSGRRKRRVTDKKALSGQSRAHPNARHSYRLSIYSLYMKQILVELDDPMAEELERAAPARSRQRSAFIRAALRRELDRLAEARIAEAYKAQPDTEPSHFDPRVWEPGPAIKGRRRRRR